MSYGIMNQSTDLIRHLEANTDPTFTSTSTDTDAGLLSNEHRQLAEQLIVILMLPLNVMGVFTNVINICVFVKMGVRNDSANIGFVSLSVFDLLSCVTLIPYCLCYLGVEQGGGYPQRVTCIAFANQFFYAHIIVQKSGAWTTVYISLMRSLCVVIPMKVKTLFTTKVTISVIASTFVLFFLVQGVYSIFFTRIVWEFDENYNISIAYVRDLPMGREYVYYYSLVSNQVLSSVAILSVSVTTSVMVYQLYQVKKWRQRMPNSKDCSDSSARSGNESVKKPLASKDVELVKSVVTAAIIFLVCVSITYIPTSAMIRLPGVNFSGINKNLFQMLFMVRFLFDSINSSINFFFYVQVSSRYKVAFLSCVHHCSPGNASSQPNGNQ